MKTSLWKFVLLLFLGTLAISAASGLITGLIIKGGIDSSNKAQAARLFKAQISGCYRQNIRTVAANKNAAATFEGDRAQIAENLLFAGAVSTPRSGATAKERKLTLAFHNRLENEIAKFENELTTLTWAPVVSQCSVSPTTVELPVAFLVLRAHRKPKENPPPPADLELSKATAGPYLR